MLKPKIGDTILVKGIVKGIFSDRSILYITNNGICVSANLEDVTEVIPKPWEPKVGEKIKHTSYPKTYEIIGLWKNKVWVTDGDVTWGSNLTDIKKFYTCVD